MRADTNDRTKQTENGLLEREHCLAELSGSNQPKGRGPTPSPLEVSASKGLGRHPSRPAAPDLRSKRLEGGRTLLDYNIQKGLRCICCCACGEAASSSVVGEEIAWFRMLLWFYSGVPLNPSVFHVPVCLGCRSRFISCAVGARRRLVCVYRVRNVVLILVSLTGQRYRCAL